MSYYSQPGMVPMGGVPMGGMPMPMGSMAGSAYGTPYPGNALMMNGMGSEYGAPFVDGYPPTIARTHSLRTPSLYGDERDLYDRDRGYYDRGYDRGYERDYHDDGYDRGRRYRDDYQRRGRSYSRSSRSRGDYYDDPHYDYDYGRGYGSDYYDRDYYDRYPSSSRYRSDSGYHSSSRYYSSGSGRRREDLSVIKKDNGDIKVLRDGQERIGDKFRRMFGLDPKGMNIVRVKRGEQLAAHISR